MSESLGVAVTTQCYNCMAGLNLTSVLDTRQVMCFDCFDSEQVNEISTAHQIADENYDYLISTFKGTVLSQVPNHTVASGGSMAEPRPLSSPSDEPSAHDWVGAVTKLLRPFKTFDGTIVDERYEFLPPISNLIDRLPNDLETSVTVLDYEVACPSCHLYYNAKSLAECPICY